MKRYLLPVLLLLAQHFTAAGASPEQDADKLVTEKSFQKALEIYQKIAVSSPEERRVLDFKIANAKWRAEASSSNRDDTRIQDAAKSLAEIADKEPPAEGEARSVPNGVGGRHDETWASANESLGDLRWTRDESRDWNGAWPCYQKALDFWAAQSDIEKARARYLNILWSATDERRPGFYYGSYGNYLPIEVLENAVKIAKSDEDKARAHYLLAMSLRYQGGDPRQAARVPKEFEEALKLKKKSNWYDNALYQYAQFLESQGKLTFQNGVPVWQPDLIEALKIYSRITSEFSKGETAFFDQAKERIKDITSPSIHLNVPYIFLPDSGIQANINWRNVKQISFAILPVDLVESFSSNHGEMYEEKYMEYLESKAGKAVKKWSKETGDDGRHLQRSEPIAIDTLPAGAYLLTASGENVKTRQLLLVTSAGLTAKTTPTRVLFYFCDVLNGKPIDGAKIKGNYRYYDEKDSKEHWESFEGTTDAKGFLLVKQTHKRCDQVYAVGAMRNQQAFVQTYASYAPRENEPYKIYCFTDRPAYRPSEKIQWKAIARSYDGKTYSTPKEEWVHFEIQDPHGNKVSDGNQKLNEFGSIEGDLTLDEKATLGEYRVSFQRWNPGKNGTDLYIGGAVLFRLEEYKLPEFKVNISTKEKAYRMGDPVNVELTADYYYGGPVTKAKVEYLIKQAPFYHYYFPPCDYPWYYRDRLNRWGGFYDAGPITERGTAETDANGKAHFSFKTPYGSPQDFQYTIEARVVDSSRREITATQTIKVTRQSYYIHMTPKQYVYQPEDSARVDIKSLDANDDPISVSGQLTLWRDHWETQYDDEKLLVERRTVVFQGYRHEKISTQSLKTNDKGDASFEFKPEREGTYRVEWASEDKDGMPITAQAMVFVCTKRSQDIGYRYGGIQIIPDRDTYHAGETARIMLVAPSNDSYAVFSVDGDDLYSYELVHFDGTVKMIELPVEKLHEPNVFLSAFLIRDAQIFVDQKEIIVPPIEQFLKVKVEQPKTRYEPREEAEITLTALDFQDKPVRTELAFGLVDESVYYIQQDYAGDIREFFYGQKRSPILRTAGTFQMHPYFKGKWDEEKKQFIPDEKMFGQKTENERVARRAKRAFFGAVPEDARGDELDEVLGSVSEEGAMKDSSAIGGGFAGFAPEARKAMAAPASTASRLETKADADKQQPGQAPNVVVRSDFRSTVLWEPAIRTDEHGQAKVKVKYPDSLTSWKATARAVTTGSQVGMGDATSRTKKDLLVRLETPRFLVEQDTAVLSGIVHNYTDKTLSVEVSLAVENLKLLDEAKRTIKVKANDEARVDWKTQVAAVGQGKMVLTAIAGKQSDAMERKIPLYEHGIEKFIARSGWSNPDQSEASMTLKLPAERNSAGTNLQVIVTPSIAVTCLDALPYLADYPYGCTEQTMSRFLPAAIVAKTLDDLHLSKNAVENRIFGGIEQKYARKTHPEGKKDLGQLDEMIAQGLERLSGMQHGDGGWGWWKEGESDHFMTAYVVQGLILANQAGVSVPSGMISRGLDFLAVELVEEENNDDMQAFMAYSLALGNKHQGYTLKKNVQKQFARLREHREKLNAYTRSLLALAFNFTGDTAKAKTLIENLENGIRADDAAQTAHWGEDGIYYRWSEGGVEATAWALKAMLAVDPQNKRVPQAMNWLVKNRRGAQWSNTRDTAMVVLAMTDYLKQSKELAQDFEYELLVNGKSIAKQSITAKNALDARSRFEIPVKFLRDGDNQIQIRKTGKGKLYHSAYLKYFTKEEPITAAGNEISVKREYFRYVGRPTLLKGYVYDKVPLKDGGQVKSGERVEVKLTIESKNNYEYLLFEDLKPAGLEAVEIRSGEPAYAQELKAERYRKDGKEEPTGRQSWAHQELRDRKVAFFLSALPEGVNTISYDLRAEIPGTFHALPTLGHAMYVPEIRCNGDETRINVSDQ